MGEVGLELTADVDARQARRAPLTPPIAPTTVLRRRENGTYHEESTNPLRWAYGPSGQLVELNTAEAEAARQRTSEESARAHRQARAEERAPEAAGHSEYQQAKRERLIAESPEHLRQLIP